MQFISNNVKAMLTMNIFLNPYNNVLPYNLKMQNADIIFNNSDVLTDASVTFAT